MAPYEKEINGLEQMQAAVGGLITAIYPSELQAAYAENHQGGHYRQTVDRRNL